VAAGVASEPTSTEEPRAANNGSTRKRPVGLVVGAVVAVAAAVGAFVVFGGSDEAKDGDASVASVPSTDSDPPSNSEPPEVVDSVDSATTQPSESAETTPGSGIALTIEVCTADAAAVSRFGVTDMGLFMLTPSGVKEVDSASLAACNIDVAGAPLVAIDVPADTIDVAGSGKRLAVSAPSGGVVYNQNSGDSIDCADLTGYAALTDDGVLYLIDDTVIARYGFDETGCTAEDSTLFSDMAASSIAVGGRKRLAVTGTERSSGDTRLWLLNGPSDVKRVDGFDALDGVLRCGDLWCALDVAAGVVHVVDLDGEFIGDAPLSSGLPAPVAEVLDLTSNVSSGAFALVVLSDGSTNILRLQI
jgi:hypothetical protein